MARRKKFNPGEFVSVEWDWSDFEVSYRNKIRAINEIVNKDETINKIADEYAKLVDPFVPYKTGSLAKYSIVDGNIIYSATNPQNGYNYAGIQYDNIFFHHPTTHHIHATDHWDEVADPIIWDEFRKKSGRIIKDRIAAEKLNDVIRYFRGK